MKTVILYTTVVVMIFFVLKLNAQEEYAYSIEQLQKQKLEIVVSEKETLKKEVEKINLQLQNNEITIDNAKELKQKVAEKRAQNIENRLLIVDNKIALIERNGIGYMDVLSTDLMKEKDTVCGIMDKEDKVKYDVRTHSDFVIAFGVNNVMVKGQSLADSDYRIAGSRFFEIGVAWRTRVFKTTNFMRVKYGISYMSNGLKPTGNRYFVENGNQTELQEFSVNLDKSKFRRDDIVIPLHLEFGPSEVEKSEQKIRYYTENKFRIGLGGYVGGAISTRQKLKYKENGESVKDKIKRDYNTNDFIYGLSGYVGFGDTALYIKYDLSPIFKNATVNQNNISLGLRFDI